MTNILGLHFGHNSHAILLVNGVIKSYIQRERISTIKNHGGINKELIEKCLSHANISVKEVEQVAITNTQDRDFFFENKDYFNFKYSKNLLSSSFDNIYRNTENLIRARALTKYLTSTEKNLELLNQISIQQYPQLQQYIDKEKKIINLSSEPYVYTKREGVHKLLQYFIDKDKDSYKKSKDWINENLLLPLEVNLSGKKLPGFFVDHHFAHIYSTASKAPFANSLIFSSDGGGSHVLGNLAAIKNDQGVFPFAITSFRGGQFYEVCSRYIDLDCGKFMGLSGYGTANIQFITLLSSKYGAMLNQLKETTFINEFETFFNLKIDRKNTLSKSNISFAANVQAIFELQYSQTISKLIDITNSNLREKIDGVSLSGGSALNCPANSIVAQRIGDKKVYIEPSCNDEGLAFGAAVCIENLINAELSIPDINCNSIEFASPFHGSKPIQLRTESINKYSNELIFQEIHDDSWGNEVARMLIKGAIGLIIKGKSEIGPRALGNRSIIAIPHSYDVANHVNQIKGREAWRPLAPACLEKYFDFFFNGPKNPYMLMTCKNKNVYFPGVIHVDGTSRVQCVDKNSENFYLILSAIDKIIKKPMLILNTSCNRKNEAMINDENTALDFLLSSNANFLVTQKYIISKKLSNLE